MFYRTEQKMYIYCRNQYETQEFHYVANFYCIALKLTKDMIPMLDNKC